MLTGAIMKHFLFIIILLSTFALNACHQDKTKNSALSSINSQNNSNSDGTTTSNVQAVINKTSFYLALKTISVNKACAQESIKSKYPNCQQDLANAIQKCIDKNDNNIPNQLTKADVEKWGITIDTCAGYLLTGKAK